jgi:copper ion binding protein
MAETLTQQTFTVPNINCGHCEMTIREDVGALPGVAKVEPSLQTKMVVVEFAPERVTADDIRKALAEAGYPAQN